MKRNAQGEAAVNIFMPRLLPTCSALALAVVGGLTSSTVLSLFLVPVMFLLFAKKAEPGDEDEQAHAAPHGASA